MTHKPILRSKQIWNLNMGYLGLQVCLTLILSNTSRILSSLGADTDRLAYLWLVAPLSGFIVQPIIGHLSDKTWSYWGRRIPYIMIGLIITAIMFCLMPNSYLFAQIVPPVIAGVSILFLTQSALNVAMQPYRSLVGDMLGKSQKNKGYSTQTFLSNIGAIVGAFLPFALTYLGISNIPIGEGTVVPSITLSFYIGVALLLMTGFYTCVTTKEYPPLKLSEYNEGLSEEKQGEGNAMKVLLRLSVVQFFSWFAFYYIWVYTTDGIAQSVWHTADPLSAEYNDAGNWFGIMSGVYSLMAAIFAILLSKLETYFTNKHIYMIALFIGSVSITSVYFIQNQYLLLLPMVGVGIAWSMILTMPFSILSQTRMSGKTGLYMGGMNITIVVPQMVAGLVGGYLLKQLAGGQAIGMMLISGGSLLLACLCVPLIKK